MMKRLVMIAAMALALVGCGEKYIVKGTIDGYQGEVKLMAHKSTECFGSAVTENGTFEIELDIDAPVFASLVVGNKSTMIFAEQGEVVVMGTLENWNELSVTGTPANEASAAAKKEQEVLRSNYMMAQTEEEKMAAEKAFDEAMLNSYEQNKDNIYGLYLLASQICYTMTPDEILEAVAALPVELQKSQGAEALKAHVEGIKRVDVGQKFIELELPDKDGNIIKLSDVLAENKYVLLDFWASWCGPCIAEVPFLLEDYAKYHDKGFEIYGVSLDKEKEEWVKTMETRGLVWPNVSELKMWKDPSAKEYAVRSIPSNFLIASDGTIVARNLLGEELGAKLAELLAE